MHLTVEPNQYDKFAGGYVAAVERSSVNAEIERPLTLELLGNIEGATILDAGCGSGPLSEILLGLGARVVGLDASTEMLARARGRLGTGVDLVLHDLNEPLPFPAASFDAIAASLVLHYVQDWRKLLEEFRRVLRPESVLTVSTHHPHRDVALGPTRYLTTEPVRERWNLGEHAPVDVAFWRRPVEQMFAAFLAAGFVVEDLREPGSSPDASEARLLVFKLRLPHTADTVPRTAAVPPHVVPGQSLCLELHVPSPLGAASWLERWGFEIVRASASFTVVANGGQLLLLGRRPRSRPASTTGTIGELRVLVDDVDAWRAVAENDEIVVELHDAGYGLREFVVESPFGLDLRMATQLAVGP